MILPYKFWHLSAKAFQIINLTQTKNYEKKIKKKKGTNWLRGDPTTTKNFWGGRPPLIAFWGWFSYPLKAIFRNCQTTHIAIRDEIRLPLTISSRCGRLLLNYKGGLATPQEADSWGQSVIPEVGSATLRTDQWGCYPFYGWPNYSQNQSKTLKIEYWGPNHPYV
jgi:hypothetical protein